MNWIQRSRLTLHGALVFEQGVPFLALGVYPNLLSTPLSDLAREIQLPYLSQEWSSFLESLTAVPVKIITARFSLPEVLPGLPLPAPQPLSGALTPVALERLQRFLKERTSSLRGVELPAALLPLSDFSRLLLALQRCMCEVPGTATPTFATLLATLQEFEEELHILQNTPCVRFSTKVLDAVGGKLPWPQMPTWEEFQTDFSFDCRDGVALPNLPLVRCRAWLVRLAAENRACTPGVPLDVTLWSRLVIQSVVGFSRGFSYADSESLAENDTNETPSLGILHFVAESLPGRPLRPLTGLLSEPHHTTPHKITLSPVVFKPQALGGTAANVQKKILESGSVVRLKDLMETDGESEMSLAWLASSPVPAHRVWFAVDLLRLCEALPHWFQNPSVALTGALALDATGLLALQEHYDTHISQGKPVLPCHPFLATLDTLKQTIPLGAPLIPDAGTPSKSTAWWRKEATDPTRTVCSHALQVEWLDWLNKSTVRLVVLVEMADESSDAPLFRETAHLEVDGEIVSSEEWRAAKKTKGGFLLPSGKKVETEEYKKQSEHFKARQQILEKAGPLKATALWQTHLSAARELETHPPEESFNNLELRLDPKVQLWRRSQHEKMEQELSQFLPPNLTQTLRPYQREGVATLLATARMGLQVCLADEMGLGKTLQTIAFLLIILAQNPGKRSLIILPKSLLGNWKREWARFSPHTSVAEWGSPQAAHAAVILVTYTRARMDIATLESESWLACVLDEAHTIKNQKTQVAAAIKRIPSQIRLGISGTPLENRATELWSLMDWLNPGYLGRAKEFERYTNRARSSQEKRLMLRPLHAALQPVLLRRTKADPKVALNLPDKVFEEHLFDLSNEQVALYKNVVKSVMAIPSDNTPQGKAHLLRALLQVKQICNHPASLAAMQHSFPFSSATITPHDEEDPTTKVSPPLALHMSRSAKVARLVELLKKIRTRSVGIVIFTQFVAMGKILLEVLAHVDERHWQSAWFLEGSLSAEERMEMVETFSEECRSRAAHKEGVAPILIASLKAGGLGLNLTDADTVIHFDRWWNPAVEDQATDRLHRMGQKRAVGVHLFTGMDTVEESIAQLMVKKRGLAHDILGAAETENIGELTTNKAALLSLIDPSERFRHTTAEGQP